MNIIATGVVWFTILVHLGMVPQYGLTVCYGPHRIVWSPQYSMICPTPTDGMIYCRIWSHSIVWYVPHYGMIPQHSMVPTSSKIHQLEAFRPAWAACWNSQLEHLTFLLLKSIINPTIDLFYQVHDVHVLVLVPFSVSVFNIWSIAARQTDETEPDLSQPVNLQAFKAWASNIFAHKSISWPFISRAMMCMCLCMWPSRCQHLISGSVQQDRWMKLNLIYLNQ